MENRESLLNIEMASFKASFLRRFSKKSLPFWAKK